MKKPVRSKPTPHYPGPLLSGPTRVIPISYYSSCPTEREAFLSASISPATGCVSLKLLFFAISDNKSAYSLTAEALPGSNQCTIRIEAGDAYPSPFLSFSSPPFPKIHCHILLNNKILMYICIV